MSSQIEKKRQMSEEDTQEPIDHRKRRRNRTTQSCLNCHDSKRMCDRYIDYLNIRTNGILTGILWSRKRPACSRCVKLGLSGTCVYEVGDVSRRGSSEDEVLLLKNRVAELEGFIREYKKKPHPRWSVDSKKRSVSMSASDFHTGSDSDSYFNSKDVASLASNKSMLRTQSIPESNSAPVTPTGGDGPIFLTRQNDAIHPPCASSSSSQNFELALSPAPVGVDASIATDVNSILDYNRNGFLCDDDAILERVFACIMQREARDSSHAAHGCQCMKHSSARSAILELVPHLHRALDSLRALPEHHAEMAEFGYSCYYLKQLYDLTEAIPIPSSILESAPETSISAPDHTLQGFCPPDNSTASTTSAEDSPLQRVLAARRAAFVSQNFPKRCITVAPTTRMPRKSWRGYAARKPWELNDCTSSSSLETPDPDSDQLMSWEPAHTEWPRTISL